MFIENLRHVKNKRRVLVGVLLGLIVVSLLFTFANVGQNIGNGGSSSDNDFLSTAETTADNAASAAKKAKDDMSAQGDAASAYLSLAAYQELFLESSDKSYDKALKYAQNMVTACASADEPDYATAYGYEISAYQGMKDATGLSTAFNKSLDKVELSQSYLNAYYTAMIGLDAKDQFVTDMKAATTKLQAQAKEEPAKEDTTEKEDSDTATTQNQEMSASDLIEYVASLVSQAQSADTGE